MLSQQNHETPCPQILASASNLFQICLISFRPILHVYLQSLDRSPDPTTPRFCFCSDPLSLYAPFSSVSVLFAPDFPFNLILTCSSLVRSVPFWSDKTLMSNSDPVFVQLWFYFASVLLFHFAPRSSCFVLPRFCYRSLYEDLCFYPGSFSWVCFNLEVLCLFVLRVFYSILDILFLFLVLSKLKFVISTLNLREGINIIRLFLGDIILEILFDIISLSVENISLWLYIGLYLY